MKDLLLGLLTAGSMLYIAMVALEQKYPENQAIVESCDTHGRYVFEDETIIKCEVVK